MRADFADRLLSRLTWADLDPGHLRNLIHAARDEDLAGLGLINRPTHRGDRSTAALGATPRATRAHLVARQPLVLAGLPLLAPILRAYGPDATVQLRRQDGATAQPGDILATLSGDPRTLLAAERVALNFVQRLSGIATQTSRYVAALGPGRTRLLDTRKTTPGWRMLEKYAVACGGGWNHRLGLFDRVMLKDNHLALLGLTPEKSQIPKTKSEIQSPNSQLPTPPTALSSAVRRARLAAPDLPVEVEVDNLAQIPPVLDAGADVILLDNFPLPALRHALALINGRALTEASGGITLPRLPRLAGLGLDFISTGALVHQSVWTDIGLDWPDA
jgi:nicotinate-nucleotide pyrophosphorylase (carboxylating)